MLSSILRINFHQIDEYLSMNNQHITWPEILQQQQQHQHQMEASNDESKREKLQTIVVLTCKIKFLHMIQSLWQTYYKSGVNELDIDPHIDTINRNVWPLEIQLLIRELRPMLFGTILNEDLATSLIPSSRNSHTCLTFIESCLYTFEKKLEHFQTMLTNEIHRLPDYTAQIQKEIDTFIEQQLLPIKIEIDCHTELIFYEYKNELHQRELEREILIDQHAIILLNQLCQLKYKQELMKTDIDLYRYMKSHSLAQDLFQEQNPFIQCTRNPNIRQQICEQYQIFEEKTQQNKLNTYLDSLEMQQQDYENEFNSILAQFWRLHTINAIHQTITTQIHLALDQRFATLTNQVTCIQKYKKLFLKAKRT